MVMVTVKVVGNCILWHGATNDQGYGQMRVRPPGWKRGDGPAPRVYVHRHAWEQVHGPIPAGMTIDHLCLVKLCMNPDHMEVVTRAENGRRGSPQQQFCHLGHPIGIYGGVRTCAVCKRQRYHDRKAAA
jgi:hypothetical protein